MGIYRRTPTRWTFGVEAEGGRREPPALGDAKTVERTLIERAQQGDHDAFRGLLERHQRRVFSLIANLVRQPSEMEDIAQQVFLKVYQALPRFDFRAAFSTWLHRITVNECYDHLRRQRAQKVARSSEIQVGDLAELDRLSAKSRAPSAPDPARRAELRQTVERLFARLSPDERLLLILRELEEFSIEEIASVLGVKENTVKVRVFRARRRLVEIHRRLMASRRPTERGG